LAFYNICFALASSIKDTSVHPSKQHTGDKYFKRARVLLGNPLDKACFTVNDIPALSLMAFYLIEINRWDAADMYLALGVR
jgi:hypothetical protein